MFQFARHWEIHSWPITQYYAVIFSVREIKRFLAYEIYFTSRWTLNDRWNPFRACGFSGQKWFELVVEGEELEDQASTQETEEFNVCTLYQQKVKNSGPLLSWLCLRWLLTIIDLFLWLISLSCMWQVLAYRRLEGKRNREKLLKLHSEWKFGSTPLLQIIAKYCSPVIWSPCRGSLELNRLTQARGSILAGRAQISRPKFQTIKVLYEQTRELTHDILDYV